MSRHMLSGVALALGACAPTMLLAQSAGMEDMPGMSMQRAGHAMPSDPQAGHHEATKQAASDQAHDGMDHSGHDMSSTDTTALPPNDHVPPSPPQHVMPAMPAEQMHKLMQMDDASVTGMLLFDRLERTRSTSGDYATSWEAEGWLGNPIDRLWMKTEGERGSEGTEGRVEALWSHAWTSFWDGQLGARQDFGQGPNRQWAAFGVQGLAPYWFETQATFYAGEQGRTALRLEASYELLFTQRLVLEPKLELNFYGKDDPQRGVSSGLSDLEAGLRLRYEFSRKFAPYVGVNWTRRYGDAQAPGAPALHARETTWVAGVRWWL